MKQVYICGDSFGCTDDEYGDYCWANQLSKSLKGQATLTNLSCVAVSNLHIGSQVKHAISNNADYIIYLATSSVRNDIAVHQTNNVTGLYTRYTDIVQKDSTKELVSYSIPTLHNIGTLLNTKQLTILKQYHSEFFDIKLAIHQNHLIIEGTLSILEHSKIPFIFDQGGFEHQKYSDTKSNQYFEGYNNYRSKINLWDYVDLPPLYRPYYHITDPQVHNDVALYYYNKIINI